MESINLKDFKILLVVVYEPLLMSNLHEELGISYIGAYLKSQGFTVNFMTVNGDEDVLDAITDMKPNLIGYTTYNASLNCILALCEKVKTKLKSVYNCLGGVCATAYGSTIMENNAQIDFVVRGEGEVTFYELALKLAQGDTPQGIEGLIYREKNRIITNRQRQLIQNIDELPWPSRDILEKNHLSVAQICTSRGCVSKCTFCTSQLIWKKWRGRDVISVVDEIEMIVNKYGIQIFNFVDNSFEDSEDRSIDRLYNLANEIVKRNLQIGYFSSFRAEFHRKATPDLMEILVKSGLYMVCVGFEAANEPDLKLYGKIATVEDNEKVIELFNKYHIAIDPGFINFNPYSTLDRLASNLQFLQRHGFAIRIYDLINRFQMYPGTALSKHLENSPLIDMSGLDEYSYYFHDLVIGQLYGHITKHCMSQQSRIKVEFEKIRFYAGNYSCYLRFTANKYYKENQPAYKILMAHVSYIECILFKLSNAMCKWFGCLLDLAKSGWDDISAVHISNEHLNIRYVQDVLKQLDKDKTNMFRKLMRIDSKCENKISYIL